MPYTMQVKSVWEIVCHSKKVPEVTVDTQFCTIRPKEQKSLWLGAPHERSAEM